MRCACVSPADRAACAYLAAVAVCDDFEYVGYAHSLVGDLNYNLLTAVTPFDAGIGDARLIFHLDCKNILRETD